VTSGQGTSKPLPTSIAWREQDAAMPRRTAACLALRALDPSGRCG
jgi:hypothetical protein